MQPPQFPPPSSNNRRWGLQSSPGKQTLLNELLTPFSSRLQTPAHCPTLPVYKAIYLRVQQFQKSKEKKPFPTSISWVPFPISANLILPPPLSRRALQSRGHSPCLPAAIAFPAVTANISESWLCKGNREKLRFYLHNIGKK